MNNKQTRYFKVIKQGGYGSVPVNSIHPLVYQSELGGVKLDTNTGQNFYFSDEAEEVFDYTPNQEFSRTDCGMNGQSKQIFGENKRVFETGASRNSDKGKLDFDGFLSPLVLRSYAEYLEANRTMEDGSVRESDNWQKGIPINQYMKSMWRHFFDVWSTHRGIPTKEDQIANLNAVLFNASGMLHELLKEERNENASR